MGGILFVTALAFTFALRHRGEHPGLDAPGQSVPDKGSIETVHQPSLTPVTNDNPSRAADEPTQRSDALEQTPDEFSFTVAIAPLTLSATDRKAVMAFRSIYAKFVTELRSIPHLDLIELSAADRDPAPDDVDFYIEALGKSTLEPKPSSLFHVSWSAQDGESGAWNASDDWSIPTDVAAIAHAAAEKLRRFPFPPEKQRPVELVARALDTNVPYDERFDAIAELRDIPKRFAFVGEDEQHNTAVAAVEIVANARDPEIRGRVWQAVANMDDPYLISPLVDSLLFDTSDFVRLQAVKLLGREFSDDPNARAAFEYALANDLSPGVRTYVRWELLDDDGRRDYLATTLLDDSLSDSERLELLSADVRNLDRFIDWRSAQALAEISRRARSSSEASVAEANDGTVDAAEVIPLLLTLMKNNVNQQVRASAATALTRHLDEPGVREALELASRDDPSSDVRMQIASYLLRARFPGAARRAQ